MTARYLETLQANWESLAESDPLWAVLSYPGMRGRRWDADAFFGTGRAEIDALFDRLAKANITPAGGTALDFGCAVGRLSQALATKFERVEGVDISPRMIQLAGELDRSGGRCHYRVWATGDLSCFPSDSFDFVCTKIVLQHIRPAHTEIYLREFARIVRPGGVIVFQLPTEPIGTLKGRVMRILRKPLLLPVWNTYRRLRHRQRGHMEMHGIAESRVRSVMASAGAPVAHAWREPEPTADWHSHVYVCVKSSSNSAT